ncbi:MAG: hypothetical protein CW338_00865, partial [Clostridiales bacterium]|nr:hypothetical protein [Clostridiales bacterium]
MDTVQKEIYTGRVFPLTDVQRGIYFECMERPETTGYNIAFALDLPPSADTERFARAVEKVAALHPALFVTIGTEDGTPVMRGGENHVQIARTRAGSVKEVKAGFVKPFDLKKDALYRFELCETPEGTVFLMDVHHLIFDGTSLYVFLSQIAAAYDGAQVEAEGKSFFEAAAETEQIRNGAGEKHREAQAFFREQLEGKEWDAGLLPDAGGRETDDLEGIE